MSLVGCYIRKPFDDGDLHYGQVMREEWVDDDGWMYYVNYHDGDDEHMTKLDVEKYYDEDMSYATSVKFSEDLTEGVEEAFGVPRKASITSTRSITAIPSPPLRPMQEVALLPFELFTVSRSRTFRDFITEADDDGSTTVVSDRMAIRRLGCDPCVTGVTDEKI